MQLNPCVSVRLVLPTRFVVGGGQNRFRGHAAKGERAIPHMLVGDLTDAMYCLYQCMYGELHIKLSLFLCVFNLYFSNS